MESTEFFLIIAVLCVQILVFFITWKQIHSVENFLTSTNNLKLRKRAVYMEDSFSDGKTEDEEGKNEGVIDRSPVVHVSVISASEDENNPILTTVISTINGYLRKNKGAAADFNLIKDIVERQTDAVDEEINHKLPVPIYLGLMGTVMGIIIGLFSLSFEFNPATGALDGELFVNSVSSLISGVKLAMICSFVGLLMTTVLSSWLYRGAKAKLEWQKNEFYNFIQTELLPQMSKDAASTILSLQANLERFNSSFESNIRNFGKIMNDIHQAFDSQVQLQQEMKKMDISRVANLNVNVLAQLHASMTEFEKFTKYLAQMNTFVHQTAKLTDSINDQLERTEAVETVVASLEDNIQKNQLVMTKLRQFLEQINAQTAVISATGKLDSVMSQAIDELRSHAEQQVRSIRDYTTEATADLKELVNAERGHLRNLDKLEKLDNMDKLVKAISGLQSENQRSNRELAAKIESLTKEVFKNTTVKGGGTSGQPMWLRIARMVLILVVSILAIIYFSKEIFAGSEDKTEAVSQKVEAVQTLPSARDNNLAKESTPAMHNKEKTQNLESEKASSAKPVNEKKAGQALIEEKEKKGLIEYAE